MHLYIIFTFALMLSNPKQKQVDATASEECAKNYLKPNLSFNCLHLSVRVWSAGKIAKRSSIKFSFKHEKCTYFSRFSSIPHSKLNEESFPNISSIHTYTHRKTTHTYSSRTALFCEFYYELQ